MVIRIHLYRMLDVVMSQVNIQQYDSRVIITIIILRHSKITLEGNRLKGKFTYVLSC